MTPEELIAAFDVVAEAPDGVARLRELVLQLAVRGKLVAQNPKDEPASVLLERIAAEKARQVKAGLIRKAAPLPPVQGDEVPYELPRAWSLVRFGDVFLTVMTGPFGTSLKKSEYRSGGTPVINPQNLKAGTISPTEATCVGEATLRRLAHFRLLERDVVVARRGEMGRCAVVGRSEHGWLCGTGSLVLRPTSSIDARFVTLFLGSPWTVDRLSDDSVGSTMKNLNQRIMVNLPFGLPPLAEQHRIVARVDELMGLLVRLEAARTTRERMRVAVRDSALDALLEAETTDAIEVALDRFTGRLNSLICDSADIAPMRVAVLQLAVRGRLVPQDPTEAPVSMLLELLAAERTRLVKARAICARDPLPPILENDATFIVPSSWRWVRFGDTHINRDAERIPLSRDDRSTRAGAFDYYGASGVIDQIDNFLFDRPQLLIGEDGANLVLRSTPIAFMARGKYWVNNHAHVLDSPDERSLAYLGIFINAIDLKPFITGTAQPKLNQARMNGIPCPLPPLAEQHRIVARVDNLMGLLDRLELRLRSSRGAHASFADAAVHTFDS